MRTRRKRVAVLISGRGSNMAALIKAARGRTIRPRSRSWYRTAPMRAASSAAEAADIPAAVVDHKAFPDRAAFEHALDAPLRGAKST